MSKNQVSESIGLALGGFADEIMQSFSGLQAEIKALRASNVQLEKKLIALEKKANLGLLEDLAKHSHINLQADLKSRCIDSVDFVDAVFAVERQYKKEVFSKLVTVEDESDSSGERALPLIAPSIFSGNYQKMLKRYFYAGKIFCSGKRVLDSCSGAGWGTYILSQYADSVVAYDRDPGIVAHCESYWDTNNVSWRAHDALKPVAPLGENFDVVTSMEAIEHFTYEEGQEYLYNHQKVLQPGGIFIASSLFPYSDEQARTSPVLQMEGHKYLWTRDKIKAELEKYFSRVKVMSSWIVMAEK